jgi:hypothetical protein
VHHCLGAVLSDHRHRRFDQGPSVDHATKKDGWLVRSRRPTATEGDLPEPTNGTRAQPGPRYRRRGHGTERLTQRYQQVVADTNATGMGEATAKRGSSNCRIHAVAERLRKTTHHSHSIVNSRSRLRGKARCLATENGPDTDGSTVAFERSSQGSMLSISRIDGS